MSDPWVIYLADIMIGNPSYENVLCMLTCFRIVVQCALPAPLKIGHIAIFGKYGHVSESICENELTHDFILSVGNLSGRRMISSPICLAMV